MSEPKLEISGYFELLNLHKTILEAKFHENPDNYYVAGSPFTAKLSNEIVEILKDYDLKHKGRENWTDWRKLSNREDIKQRMIKAIVRDKEIHKWENLNFVQKKEIILNYISPFTCTETELSNILNEIENKIY